MIANVKIAIGGGINEPRDALLTILYGLLTNPDQLEAVRAGDKWRGAFEEGVRWVAPIQASSRLVMEDTEIRGCLIPKGDTVMTIQASANRDEEIFEDGETFNALREPNPHQSFGNGPHHCAGAHIARRTVGAHPAADAVRAFSRYDLARSLGRTLARLRLPRPAQSAGVAAVGEKSWLRSPGERSDTRTGSPACRFRSCGLRRSQRHALVLHPPPNSRRSSP